MPKYRVKHFLVPPSNKTDEQMVLLLEEKVNDWLEQHPHIIHPRYEYMPLSKRTIAMGQDRGQIVYSASLFYEDTIVPFAGEVKSGEESGEG